MVPPARFLFLFFLIFHTKSTSATLSANVSRALQYCYVDSSALHEWTRNRRELKCRIGSDVHVVNPKP